MPNYSQLFAAPKNNYLSSLLGSKKNTYPSLTGGTNAPIAQEQFRTSPTMSTPAPNMSTPTGPKYAPPPASAATDPAPTKIAAPAAEKYIDSLSASAPTAQPTSMSTSPAVSMATPTVPQADPNAGVRSAFETYLKALTPADDGDLYDRQNSLLSNASKVQQDYAKRIAETGALGAGAVAGNLSTGTSVVGSGNAAIASQSASQRMSALADAQKAEITGLGFEEQGLQNEIARRASGRESLSEAAKARFDFEQGLLKSKNEESRYQDERTAEKAALEAKQNEPFELSEGQVRYAINPETGKYEQVANVPKTYAPKASTGLGGTGGTSADPFTQSLYNTAGGKALTDTTIQKLDKGLTVLGQLGALQTNIADTKTGPITGAFRGANPWDTNAQTIKAQLNAVVPNLARGVYGEVGVLTDNDIKTYANTLPNLKSTEAVRNAVLYITLDMIGKSIRNTLSVNAAAGRDVSGFVDIYEEMEATKNSILNSIPGAQVPKSGQPSSAKPSGDPEYDTYLKALDL